MPCRPLCLRLHHGHHLLPCTAAAAISPRVGEMSAEPTEGGELALTTAGELVATRTLRTFQSTISNTIPINQNLQKSHANAPVGLSSSGDGHVSFGQGASSSLCKFSMWLLPAPCSAIFAGCMRLSGKAALTLRPKSRRQPGSGPERLVETSWPGAREVSGSRRMCAHPDLTLARGAGHLRPLLPPSLSPDPINQSLDQSARSGALFVCH